MFAYIFPKAFCFEFVVKQNLAVRVLIVLKYVLKSSFLTLILTVHSSRVCIHVVSY